MTQIRTKKTRHYFGVLLEHLPAYLEAGWCDDDETRNYPPSVAQPICLIHWDGEGDPPIPDLPERTR